MHEMQIIVINVPGVCAKVAEQIEILVGVETLGKPRNVVLNRGLGSQSPLQI